MESMVCEELFEKTFIEETYDQFNFTIVGILVYGLGLTIGTWVVSKCIWDKDVVLESIDEEEEELYTDKYPLNSFADLSGNEPSNTSIIEQTPNGSVIMSYNYDKEGFEYWSDNKNIKYDVLETVARKFVKMNFCSHLYVDRKENIQKQNEELDRLEEENKRKEEEQSETDKEFEEIKEEDSIFIKSKLSLREKQKEEVIDRKKIAATKANKYIRVGKCNEFKWLRKMKIKSEKKKISFSDYKNHFC